jgi:RNA polymerase sigma-70 factor, ECF subfamily
VTHTRYDPPGNTDAVMWRGMDADLVIRAQHGDTGAYSLIATEIADRFLAVARRILRDRDLAEDATQQALLTAWQDLPQLRDPTRFEAWSYRLLVRACYTEGRKERRWAPNLRLLPTDDPTTDDDLSSVADRDQLERGFRRLTMDHRTVVVLHHYLDLPLDRVADILGIPVGTAHSRLHHAMRALRAALEADLRPAAREVI